jgi:glycosyltransferase involved in cell wall biosynthesis
VSDETGTAPRIAVIIPCYRVKRHILDVITRIPESVFRIYVVDDQCPEQSGAFVAEQCADPRIRVLTNPTNMGVGGAVLRGYESAIADNMDVIVKIDGDGQMDPRLIDAFTSPILKGEADYTKGNRFFEIETFRDMPTVRVIGNIGLSFITKVSSGYWNLFDPTNGYTAIHAGVASHLPLKKISQRYFFESDMLFRLNTLRAVVVDIPMNACYQDEVSGLDVGREILRFLWLNSRNFVKRIYYNYLLRNFSFASIELFAGITFLMFGGIYGSRMWVRSYLESTYASAGTVMLAGLTTLIGLQLLLGFANFDMGNVPTSPLHKALNADARRNTNKNAETW